MKIYQIFFVISIVLFFCSTNGLLVYNVSDIDFLKLEANHHLKKWQSLTDGSCPIVPIPVYLNSLPSSITQAFQTVELLLQQMLVQNTSGSCLYGTAVYRDKVIWKFGAGLKTKNQPGAPDENTIFRIGSVSKIFPVLMAYQLQEKGILHSLDDRLVDYAPKFSIKNPYSGSNGITFRQVSTQLSGLPRETPCVIPCAVTSEDIYKQLENQYLIHPPNTQPSYSNLGYSLIGRILESVVKTNFEKYSQDQILSPLKMKNTGFTFTSEVIQKMATGYNPDGTVAPLYDLGWNAPCGQMYSSGADLAAFMITFLQSQWMNNTKPILSDPSMKEMLSPVFVNIDGQTMFGAPWEIQSQFGYLVRRKGGNVSGYSALFSVIPELQLGVSILFNGQADEFAFSNAVYNILIPAFVNTLKQVQPPIPQPPNQSGYVGQYEIASGQTGAIVSISNGILLLQSVLGNVYLGSTGYGNSVLKIVIPQGIQPCLDGELLALNDQLVYFQLNGQGVPVSFSIPGFVYGITFTKKT